VARDVVIRAEGLGKKYIISHTTQRSTYVALRDVWANGARNLHRSAMGLLLGRPAVVGEEAEEFWALKDIDFEIERGELMGVIGRNGAGKSTLLKILSRITEPSEGKVTIHGSVASLLEVGTGFHPELTGRENIYLNGAILGMGRGEIKRKFDEIVDFAEVERFLDTPVKRYSSGMYVRLAFAVAAHLEPDILVVDEVLAVGDAEFQKKCLGKLSEVAGGGRTVLFVSHSMGSLSSLCDKGILLRHGRIGMCGDIRDVVAEYVNSADIRNYIEFSINNKEPSIRSISVDAGALARGDLLLKIGFSSPFPLSPAVGGVTLRSTTGHVVWGTNSRFHPSIESVRSISTGTLKCEAKHLPLIPGSYTLSVWLGGWHEDYDAKQDVLNLVFRGGEQSSLRPRPEANGNLDWDASWSVVGSEIGADNQYSS